MKRKGWSLLACLVFCLLLGGCKEEAAAPVVALQEIWTEHKTEDYVYAYTLDEDGSLYTLENDMDAPETPDPMLALLSKLTLEEIKQLTPEELEQYMPEKAERFFLRKYSPKGELEYSKALDEMLSSYVKAMAVKDGKVYFMPYTHIEGELCAMLCSYCPETEELVMMKELPYFKSVSRIIPMDDCIYLLGTNVEGYDGQADSRKYVYGGEKILCYSVSEDKVVELGIEEPMDMCPAEDGKLFIYAHMGEEFCLLLYDTERDSMKAVSKTNEYKLDYVAFCSERNAIIYVSLGRGLVLSSLTNLEVESELHPEIIFSDSNLCYVNGNVASRTSNGESILQFPLDEVACENKTLRYITAEMAGENPFGCGYEMQRTELAPDKFALKVMALDKDFDVCCVNSSGSFSYNMKKNGVFYPLNDVPGVKEYLDACFPYGREAATDRDGNIWMFPISVDIKGMLAHRDAAEYVLLKENMTYAEYCAAYEALSEEQKTWVEPPITFINEFIVRYILDRGTIDTEEFRAVLKVMAESNSVPRADSIEASMERYTDIFFESDYRSYSSMQNYGTDALVCAYPKLKATDKNMGYCQFLAVNPYSDNLEETLQYIATLVAYMMEKEEVPLFFEDRDVEDNEKDRALYELYRNGEIIFSVDGDVYGAYSNVLNGTLDLEEYVAESETKVKIFLNE